MYRAFQYAQETINQELPAAASKATKAKPKITF
jgi:hypothetical protein